MGEGVLGVAAVKARTLEVFGRYYQEGEGGENKVIGTNASFVVAIAACIAVAFAVVASIVVAAFTFVAAAATLLAAAVLYL